MATPPPRGVGMTCTSRSRGAAIIRKRIASIRTTGVVRKVTTAAVSRTTAYSRIGSAGACRLGGAHACDRPSGRSRGSGAHLLRTPGLGTGRRGGGAAVGQRYREGRATLRVARLSAVGPLLGEELLAEYVDAGRSRRCRRRSAEGGPAAGPAQGH